jgi:nucleotide-binding universal stress UspA family protein
VELTHVVPVPIHVPLTEADQHMRPGRQGIIEVMNGLGPEFSIGTNLRYCRNIARGILTAAKEKRSNLLVMGWHGQPRSSRFRIGSTIDPIIERSPCRVVLTKGCTSTHYRRVLVATAGGPNGGLALEIASILAEEDVGELTLMAVGKGHNLPGFVEENRNRLLVPKERVKTLEVEADDVVEAILEQSKDYDLVVIGCTRVPLLTRLRRDPIPEQVARRCDKPLVMVNVPGYIQGWLNRWV